MEIVFLEAQRYYWNLMKITYSAEKRSRGLCVRELTICELVKGKFLLHFVLFKISR
jgi:hypothetical protein